jgi:benzylsuccinate CoA-transferase BbsF subunit
LEGILKNIRVIDLGINWAAPYCTELLADMGAEVIKVESLQGDQLRSAGRPIPGEKEQKEIDDKPYNRAGHFLFRNRNKLGISLDLRREEGKELFKKLISISDIVIDNFRAGTMDRLGLGYDVLKRLNPGIIMVSLSGFGAEGPDKSLRAVGVTIEPYCLASITGYPDDERPMRSGVDHGDPFAGAHAAGAILASLIHKRKTGQGIFIDVSMVESVLITVGPMVLDWAMNRRLPRKIGNDHLSMAPHGCYRCKGDDKWVTITVGSDDEWKKLCLLMDKPTLTEESKFADVLSRWKNRRELNQIIEEWTCTQENTAILKLLQEDGIAAGPVLNVQELLNDVQLKARNFFPLTSHPAVGAFQTIGARFRFSQGSFPLYRHAPCFGEHNQEVAIHLLGLSEREFVTLTKEKVFGTEPKSSRLKE